MRVLTYALALCSGCLSLIDPPITCEAICEAPLVCVEGKCRQVTSESDAGQDAGAFDAGDLDVGAAEAGASNDDGGTISDTGTRPDAAALLPAPVCGNQALEAGEDCDDGNQAADDGCLSNCRWSHDASAGHRQTCFRIEHSVYCAGSNGNGQLGDGTTDTRQGAVPVSGRFVDIASLAAANCAVTTTGTVQCWGSCEHGALGSGALQDCLDQPAPTTVEGPESAVQIAAGDWFACARLRSGEVWCWGHNEQASLGRGNFLSSTRAAPVIGIAHSTQIAAGGYHTCSLDRAAVVSCWGASERGQLGPSANGDTPEPIAMDLPPVASIAAGGYHTCVKTVADEVWCWGTNREGQFGMTTPFEHQRRPIRNALPGIEVTGLFGGNGFTCLRSSQAQIFCSGRNTRGQLGLGDTTARSSFELVPDLFIRNLGSGARANNTIVVDNEARFWVWGQNDHGELGLSNQTATHSSPQCVVIGPGQSCP